MSDWNHTYSVGAGQSLSVEDALVMSMNRYGSVNVGYMADLTDMDAGRVIRALQNVQAIYPDPSAYDPDSVEDTGWLMKNSYVRGNIYELLKEAKAMEKKYPGVFAENIKILQAALPASPDREEIHVSLGAPWVPESFYADFIRELLKTKEKPEVTQNRYLGKWIIRCKDADDVANKYIYGTKKTSAVEIIEHTMNEKAIVAKDSAGESDSAGRECVCSHREIVVLEKQKAIIQAFQEWLDRGKGRRERLAEIYIRNLAYQLQRYDGSWLRLGDMSGDVILYPYQKDAVARCILSENVLLAHKVGSGKTYEMICSMHELHRMGLSSRALAVVPNQILDAFVRDHRLLYPADEILVIYPKDFTPDERGELIDKIRRGNYVAVYMAYSSFDMLTMSRRFYLERMQNEIYECSEAIRRSHNIREKHALEAGKKRLHKRYEKLQEDLKDTKEACFDSLGIDLLVLDECHNYKNVTLDCTVGDIVGLHVKGSKKCDEMMEKVHFVQKSGGRIIFATGTPLTNSMTDLFVLQQYLQREELECCGMEHFSQWISTFGEKETSFEIDIDSQNYRMKSRYSRFHNLPELMALFSNVCDFRNGEKDENLPEFMGYEDVMVKKSELQAMFIEDLARRTEEIHSGVADRKEDNLLKVTIDGRKCALDMRLIDKEFTDRTVQTKTALCAEKVLENYRLHPGTSQIVFCDSSTPKQEFNIYDELRENLVQRGVPEREIVFIHEGTTENKRRKLLEALNDGAVRIMVGSTQKLGTGVNVQKKLLAVHHLDIPWRPSDMVQREGRLIRQGNQNSRVLIYRYIMEGSFDSYSWQLLESKQKFITSFLEGTMDEGHRTQDDIADTILTYAEAKALAIGNPLIKKRVETANHLERMKISRRQRRKQLEELRSLESSIPADIKKQEQLAGDTQKDMDYYSGQKESISKEDREMFGEDLLEALQKNELQTSDRLFDWYQGFKVLLPAHMNPEAPYIILTHGQDGMRHVVKMDGATAAGCSRRMDYVLNHLPEALERHCEKLKSLKRRKEEIRKELQAGNPYEEQVERTAEELARIDAESWAQGSETGDTGKIWEESI